MVIAQSIKTLTLSIDAHMEIRCFRSYQLSESCDIRDLPSTANYVEQINVHKKWLCMVRTETCDHS